LIIRGRSGKPGETFGMVGLVLLEGKIMVIVGTLVSVERVEEDI